MRRNKIKEKAKEKEKKHRISIGQQISKVSYDRLFFPSSSARTNHYQILRRRRRERGLTTDQGRSHLSKSGQEKKEGEEKI